MRKDDMKLYDGRVFKSKEELNSELRNFMWSKVPKKVHLAITISHQGEINEKMVTLLRDITLGKQHWMYSEFIEHNGHMLPKWYVNAKLQNDKLVSSS
jgi:hypothetical protein